MNKKSGQNWLLLRGLSRESAHWGKFIGLMHATFPAAKIHTLDLPGTGRFYRSASPDTISAIMESVRQEALELGILKQPITILALSLGGMVAWEWMHKYPGDVNGAVLVNTSFASLSPFYRRLHWHSYGKFVRIMLESDLYTRELGIVRLVVNRRNHDECIAEEWLEIQQERPVSIKNSLRQITAAARYKPSVDKPEQPVLLLNSRGDRLVSPTCSEAIHKHWQIELNTHPWAGHDLSLDDGDWLANQLKDWVYSLSVPII